MSGLLTLQQLLVIGISGVLLLAGSFWALSRQEAAEKNLAGRVDRIAAPYAPANPLQEMGRERAVWSSGGRIWSIIGGLFSYDPERAAFYPLKAPVIMAGTLVAAIGLGELVATVIGPSVRMADPAAWVMLTRLSFSYFENKRAGLLYAQFPDALAMIVRSVRVGIPVSEAVRNVAREALEPTATEFAIMTDQLAIGVPLDEALRNLAARNRLPEYRFFATALTLQAQTGGGLSETLENLADVIRKRVSTRKRAYALASEARTSTYILAALPVVTGGGLALINPAYFNLLFAEHTGRVVLAIAVGMLIGGMGVMRTIISRSLR